MPTGVYNRKYRPVRGSTRRPTGMIEQMLYIDLDTHNEIAARAAAADHSFAAEARLLIEWGLIDAKGTTMTLRPVHAIDKLEATRNLLRAQAQKFSDAKLHDEYNRVQSDIRVLDEVLEYISLLERVGRHNAD